MGKNDVGIMILNKPIEETDNDRIWVLDEPF